MMPNESWWRKYRWRILGVVAIVAVVAVALSLKGCSARHGSVSSWETAPPVSTFQPVTPVATPTPTVTPSASVSPSATPSPTPTPAKTKPPAKHYVVVLDPGHGKGKVGWLDKPSGVWEYDDTSTPEISEVYRVAQMVQTKLEKDGYTVLIDKGSADTPKSARARADFAAKHHANIGVSIHDDHRFASSWAQVYAQTPGGYRMAGRPPAFSGRKVTFAHLAGKSAGSIAAQSGRYARVFARVRSADEHHKVSLTAWNREGQAESPPGNIPMVSLLGRTPWVYNEIGAKVGSNQNVSMSLGQLRAYAKGLADAIEKCLPR